MQQFRTSDENRSYYYDTYEEAIEHFKRILDADGIVACIKVLGGQKLVDFGFDWREFRKDGYTNDVGETYMNVLRGKAMIWG